MGGGITYRLSPQERELFGDSIPILQTVMDRMDRGGVRPQLTDPEMTITSEETSQGTRFLLVYPLDNDNQPKNGRIYLQDEFILSKNDQRLVQFRRTFRQDLGRNRRNSFWVDLAKSDHPPIKDGDSADHLQQFLTDLEKIPRLPLYDGDLVEFHGKVLKNLHRPFPGDFKKIAKDNGTVYQGVSSIIAPYDIRIYGSDSQSGIVVRREGDRVFLQLVLVLDNRKGSDPPARESSRIYMRDEFELDARTHELLEFRRNFFATPDLDPDLSRALAELKLAPPPPLHSPELSDLAQRTLSGLGFSKTPDTPAIWDFNYRPPGKLAFSPVAWGSIAFKETEDGRQTARRSLHLAKIAATEYLEELHRADGAWLLPGSGAPATRDHEKRKAALEGYFQRIESFLEKNDVSLGEAMERVPPEGDYEKFLWDRLRADGTLKKIFSALEERDPVFRQAALLHLIQNDLTSRRAWARTTEAFLGTLNPADSQVRMVTGILSGKGNFGQRFERLLPHLASEMTSPRVLGAMVCAGTIGSLGKILFISRFGRQGWALRLGAEGAALLGEAPAFVLANKFLVSSLDNPVGVWDHWGDLGGAFLAFGVLRGAGYVTMQMNQSLQHRYFRPGLALEDFAGRPLAQRIFRLGQFRPWVPGFLQGTLHHGGGMAAIVMANGLGRSLGLLSPTNPEGPSGWSEDLLFYGQFVIGGNLAQRIRSGTRLGEVDFYLRHLENPTGAEGPPVSKPSDPIPTSANQGTRLVFRLAMRIKGWFPRWFEPKAETTAPNSTATPAPIPETVSETVFAPIQNEAVPREVMPPEFFKTGPIPIFPGTGKPVEADAFLKTKFFPLPQNDPQKREWIVGRDDPKGAQDGDLPDFIVPLNHSGIHPRHLRILLKEAGETEGEAGKKVLQYFLEPLNGVTFLNDYGLDASAGVQGPLQSGDVLQLGESGKRITFKMDTSNQFGFLEEDLIPLDPKHPEWRIGRATPGKSPEIPISSIDRQVSRLHARIFRDDNGQYFLQDWSREGTWVEGRRVYGTVPLYHKDKIQLGLDQYEFRAGEDKRGIRDSKTLWFELPKSKLRAPAAPLAQLPHFPKKQPPPPQAEVLPIFRGLSQEEVDSLVREKKERWEQKSRLEQTLQAIGLTDSQLKEAGVGNKEDQGHPTLLATLKFSNQLELEIGADKTGYILGSSPADPGDPPNTLGLELPDAPELAPRHARLFVDADGRFILQDLEAPQGIYVHARSFRDVEESDPTAAPGMKRTWVVRKWKEIPEALPYLQRVAGWTYLQGGERIFLGRGFYFDFWPSSPRPQETPQGPASGETERPSSTPIKSPDPNKP